MRLFAVCLVAASLAFAGTVTYDVELLRSDVTFESSEGYTIVRLDHADNGILNSWTTESGEPLLPVLSGNVLIPAGAVLEEVTVTELDRVELGVDCLVYPVQPMRPLSEFSSVPFVEANPAVYASDRPYPAQRVSSVPAGSKAGFRIGGFRFCPFEYEPSSGRLTLVTRARVKVSYRENVVHVPALTKSQRELAANDVSAIIVNPEDVERMAPPAVEYDGEELDVVLFTSSELGTVIGPLRDWLMRKGYFTDVVVVDTLSYPGRDTPEKMRNLLIEKFATKGLKYVILAGDYQHVPVRYGYLPYSTYEVPADMYFGDLDGGDWDANGNSRFGEMDGDSVDLFHDIYVGRLPFDDVDDINNFVHKDTTFELVPDTAALNNALFPSEWLWQNIDFSGKIVNLNIIRALQAYSTWEIDSGLNMTSSQAIASVNAGLQQFHFAGHGSQTAFGSTFSTGNIPSLTNVAMPCVVMSMACHCGWFDTSSDCLGEMFVNATNGGAVATLLNARYGWGAPPAMGPNSNLNTQFYHNFLKGYTVGQSHGLARDFLRNESFSQMTMRWAMYTNTLQGDPTMRMWRAVPAELAVIHPDTIAAVPQAVQVQVDCGDEAVRGARVAITHMGELLGRAVTNSRGYAWVHMPEVQDTFTLKLSVSAQDAAMYEAPMSAVAGYAGALVVPHNFWADDGNGRLDPGDDVDAYVVVKNIGNSPAYGASGHLLTYSPYVTITDSTSDYGDIFEGDTARGDVYHIKVEADCPQGHVAEFVLTVDSDTVEGSHNTGFELVIGMRHARGGMWATQDTGDYCLSVCANGGIGSTQWRGEGYGFIYPKNRLWSSSAMMHGGLILGTDTSWVCDNYYGDPWRECPMDFTMVDSLYGVYPPELGDKEFICRFDDSSHPEPKGLVIDHRSYGSALPQHEDFVVLEYRIHNTDTMPVENLWAGIGCDFRTAGWNANDEFDYAGIDSARNLAFIKSAASGETLALGIRHIFPAGMNGYANCISHTSHIENGFTKAEKMGFLDGTLRQTEGMTAANWHAMSSSGPYTIPANDSQIVAFMLGGGRTSNAGPL